MGSCDALSGCPWVTLDVGLRQEGVAALAFAMRGSGRVFDVFWVSEPLATDDNVFLRKFD